MSVVAHPDWKNETEILRLKALYQLLVALNHANNLDDVYEAAITSLLNATTADRAAILIFGEDGAIRFQAWRNLSVEYRQAVTGHAPWPKGTHDAKPVVVRDVLLDKDLVDDRELFSREGIRAAAFIPLALEAGVFGEFMLCYSAPYECTADELAITQAIASHVSIAAERKRAELACSRSEQLLQAVLDNSPSIIFVKDLQGRYMLVNPRYEELFRIRRADIVGRTDYDVFTAEVAERLQENERKVLDAGAPLLIEEETPQADGIHTYISVKFPLQGCDGKLSGVCGIAMDITDRKRLETASQRLAAIVESSDDAIVSKDLSGIISSWNKGAERIFGYTAEEAIGKPVSLLMVPDRLNEMPEILSQIKRGLRIDHYETLRRTKDGRTIQVSLTVSPVRDASGQIIGASKIARDITGQKAAEQERASLLSREQEARRTAELLNQVSPRLVAELDLKKLVQIVTDTATDLVGAEFGAFFRNAANEGGESYLPNTLSGASRETVADFSIPRFSSLFGTAFRGAGAVRCDDVTQDSRYGNNPPWMPKGLPVRSYLAVSVASRSGEVLGALIFGHSMPGRFTEFHEVIVTGIAAQAATAIDNARLFEQSQWVQAELKRSNGELKRANQDLETFAYSASHDLQEPLRTIAISAQLLERSCGNQLKKEDASFLENIVAASSRMSALIQDLLAYTKATKYAEGQPASVDAEKVLAGVLEYLKGLLEETGATVTSAPLPAIHIHESRLAQLFQNLISNAVKYRGKEAPRVHISADERDGRCVFSVSDNGIGIESQYAEQIFGLFKRLHARDQYPGSGIGLAICQRIVEQYGGRIWLEICPQ